jgi:hypothetical protein
MEKVMPKDRDKETGKYTETYPIDEYLSALESLGGSGGTQEVADEVGCAYRTAYAKLTQLEKDGDISSRKVGNARLWKLKKT